MVNRIQHILAAAIFIIAALNIQAQSSTISLDSLCNTIARTDALIRDDIIQSFSGKDVRGSVEIMGTEKSDQSGYTSVLTAKYSRFGIDLFVRLHIRETDVSEFAQMKKIDFTGRILYLTPLNSSYTRLSADITLSKGTITIE